MREAIKEVTNSYESDIINLTRELIQIRSHTGEEGEIINFLVTKMEELEFDEITIDAMGNLIGRIGTGPKIIAIDGHVDTVDIGELNQWKFDPLGGVIDSGKIYGRGACDQKSGIAAALIAIKILKEIGLPKELTIYFVASIHEEPYEGANWQYILANSKIKPNAVLLTEPSNLAICIGQRGRVDLKIKVKGRSSHGAEPDLGKNAIYAMNPIIKEIEELHQNLPEDKIFGKGTITITEITSTSVSLNAVADSCSIHLDRRLGQDDTLKKVKEEITSLSSVIKAEAEVYIPDFEVKTYKNYSYEVSGYYPTWLMEKTHPLVQNAKLAYELLFDQKPKIGTWRFSTNGVAIKGLNDIPTIGFGPGEEQYAHTYDEHVAIEHLLKATQFYIAFLVELAKKK